MIRQNGPGTKASCTLFFQYEPCNIQLLICFNSPIGAKSVSGRDSGVGGGFSGMVSVPFNRNKHPMLYT